MADVDEENDDLFSDSYVSPRSRRYHSIKEIQDDISDIGSDERDSLWQKHTRKKTKSTPESSVKSKIKDYVVRRYRAKILRTNAGSVVDREGNTIYLGETGQADLHAIIPIKIGDFTFGIFAAIEVKAPGRKPSQKYLSDIKAIKNIRIKNQAMYIEQVRSRGGIALFADSTSDVDEAILEKSLAIQLFLAGYHDQSQ